MAYITTVFNKSIGALDIAFVNNTVLTGNDIPSLMLTQLFSCAFTDATNTNWVGNSYGSFQVGSSFQTLLRSSTGGQFLLRARDLIKNALQPLVKQGIVAKIDVPTPTWNSQNGSGAIIGQISVTLPNATDPVLYNYNYDLNTSLVSIN